MPSNSLSSKAVSHSVIKQWAMTAFVAPFWPLRKRTPVFMPATMMLRMYSQSERPMSMPTESMPSSLGLARFGIFG